MEPRRNKDGRFVPRTGDVADLPRIVPYNARDEHGRFIPKEKVKSSKPYSRAVQELFLAPEGTIPPHWPNPPTEAQALAMVHFAQAKSGNVQVGMMLVDRGEGKVPQAAEDREAAVAAGSGIRLLADLLGIKVIDAEVIDEETHDLQQRQLAGVPEEGEEGVGEESAGGRDLSSSTEAGSSPSGSGPVPSDE